jgi:hypothetical protein
MNQHTDTSKKVAIVEDDDLGGGFEGVGIEAYALPFLKITQKSTKFVDEEDPNHIPGAKPGMIFNTVTKKLYDGKKGLLVVPCFIKHSYIRWGARNSENAGFKGEITPQELDQLVTSGKVALSEGKHYAKDSDGNFDPRISDTLVDTRSHYLITLDPDGDIGRAVFPMTSTQIKASRTLMSVLRSKLVSGPDGQKRTPATYASQVRLSTSPQKSEKGDWFSTEFAWEDYVGPDLYEIAKAFKLEVQAGTVKVDHSKFGNDEGSEVSGDAKASDSF